MIKLIASDMDGTLLNGEMQISSENIRAIKHAQKMGIEFLVATGRTRNEALPLLKKAGLDTGYININGAQVYDTQGNLVIEKPIARNKALEVIKILKESGSYFEIASGDHVYSESRIRRISNVSDLLVDLNKHLSLKNVVSFAGGSDQVLNVTFIDSFEKLFADPNFKVMKFVVFDPAGPQAFKDIRKELKKIGGLVGTASSSTNLEINHEAAQKGIALLDYGKAKNITPQEIMAIGDNFNDESMIKMAGIGVAMENAVPEIKEIASFITKNNNASGVAHAIYTLTKS
ncbi:HAD family phosphatase [Lactobacillus sp. PV037]|uniref:Cof-type HAD-IIB family hydrolase n=1 Tax=unclassified Lactobacillus TaxID=2620435 RepID=UPI002240E283|nr:MULTISPECIES: Cof-type HAD-IIB family hydrolase [unclassified Lactobacillus]QNQ82538.1 HAD family phosphatase [Lactobacillus sp. PV012]QNQ83346.1 HAD family phosphatase [Lactobacillus sp. PV037]